jgi:hypothetical protein
LRDYLLDNTTIHTTIHTTIAGGGDAMSVAQWKGDFQSIIRLEHPENPKRPGSKARERYKLYRDGMTVQDYVNACESAPKSARVRRNDALVDLAWDSNKDHNFIRIVKAGG